jgi:hypothetical protein
MAWDYGTITDANPADALMDKIEACMTDAAWTFEEELTAGEMGTSGLGRIWHNSNGFHIAIEVYEGGHQVNIRLAEGYNATTNKCTCPAMTGANAVGADYSYGNSAEYTWGTAVGVNTGTLNTTGFTYAISATANYLFVATLVGAAAYHVHAGKFDTLMASDPGPYAMFTTASFYFTRVPNTTGTQLFYGNAAAHTFASGVPGTYDTQHGAIVLSRVRCQNRQSTDPGRGLAKGLVIFVSSGSYAFGDELDVTGTPKYKVFGSQPYAIEMI